MTKRHVDEAITITGTFRNDAGVATDPTAVTFTYRVKPHKADTDVTPTKTGVGVYEVTITPTEPGNLYGFFKGTGALVKTIPVQVPIFPKQGSVGQPIA